MDWSDLVRSSFDHRDVVPDADVIEELAQHARATHEAAMAQGLSEAEADHRVADLLARWRADARALNRPSRAAAIDPPPLHSPGFLSGLAHDVRYAIRLLWRQPRSSLLVAATMALGIGATTLLASVTYGVLVRPLPWPTADRLIVLNETRGGRPPRFGAFTNVAFHSWQGAAQTIDGVAAWSASASTLTGDGEPERIQVTSASGGLFYVLGAHPLVGALFDSDADVSVVVISERLWARRFSADRAIAGKFIRLDSQPRRVVGVLPDRFAFPNHQTDAWVPQRVAPASNNALSLFNAIALLKPGVSPAQAAAEATARGRFVPDTGLTTTAIFGGNGPIDIHAVAFAESLTTDVRRALIVLIVAVGLLLAGATANIAGLQATRAAARRREMSIRAAIGAGMGRLARQLLIENLVVCALGASAGVALAATLHGVLPSILPADFPRVDDIRMDTTVIGIAAALCVLTSLGVGWLPALRARSYDLVRGLADSGAVAGRTGRRGSAARTRAFIMTGQVAVTCMLLIGASLLGRSFQALVTIDRGYNPSGVLTGRLSLPGSLYPAERRYEVVRQVLDRLSTIPGVTAGFTSELPVTAGGSSAAFTLPSRESGVISAQASPRIVSAGAFDAMGMRVVAGRGFSDADTETSEPVVVVNRRFAQQYLTGDALGAKIPMGAGYQNPTSAARLIGEVDDVRYLAPSDSSFPEIYYSYRQFAGRLPVQTITLLMRGGTAAPDNETLAGAMRTGVRSADGNLVVAGIMTLEDRLLVGLARPRLYAIVLGLFAVLAIVVAGVGLFGVLSLGVAQRSHELALRTALGATRSQIVRIVARHAATIVAAGTAIGLLSSFLLTPSLGALLYGVGSHDPLTYVAVPMIVGLVGAVACVGPALRAVRINTVRDLR